MAATSFFKYLARPQPYICKRCIRNRNIARESRRAITQNFLRKTYDAELEWKAQAVKIKAGKKQNMMSILEERGFVKDIAGEKDALSSLMTEKRIGAYVGIDPTAPSLHMGHLLPLMTLFWMYMNGFHAVTLLGGATAKIGDPTGRTTAREQKHSDVHKANVISMHLQLKQLWVNVGCLAIKYGYRRNWSWKRGLLNNNSWINKLTMMDLMKVLGSGTRVGTMLNRDSVKTRLESGNGMSFSEFCYPLLQAWDWWHMYNTIGVQVQIGGSDQFGNICAGMDAINYIRKTYHDPSIRQEKEEPLMAPYGFTTPLLTTSSGAKFGKSAGNAIWLDPEMLSSFDLYQFFLRSSDSDVERYLKLFTFLPLEHIELVMQSHIQDPSKRAAQHLLAREFVELAHGAQAAKNAEMQHKKMFSRGTGTIQLSAIKEELPKKQIEGGPATKEGTNAKSPQESYMSPSLNRKAPAISSHNAPSKHIVLPKSLVFGQAFPKILHAAGLASSKGEGHKLVMNQGAYVASDPGRASTMGDALTWLPIKNFDPELPKQFLIEENLLVLRVGKWNIRMCRIINDEEFETQGHSCPGWEEFKAAQAKAKAVEQEFKEAAA
ncbi:tyrosyl-tRNA synthetase-like protein [Cenococcum geophilum]